MPVERWRIRISGFICGNFFDALAWLEGANRTTDCYDPDLVNLGAATMRIEHIALWTNDLERCKAFYTTYFGATPGAKYVNAAKGFESCFLSFGDGARIEAMTTSQLAPLVLAPGIERMGLTHLAISVGSEAMVDRLTQKLRKDGFPIEDGPRRTGDGYYESVVLDPDGNRIEIAA